MGQWHFHQDNIPVHNSILVTHYLTKMGIKTFPQPPHSPDLAPCKFCLFPKLRGCRHETIEEMKEAVRKVIDTLTQDDFHGAFEKLLERYNKCIAAGEDYFERGLEFQVCNINECARSKKSGNLFNVPRKSILLISRPWIYGYDIIDYYFKAQGCSQFFSLTLNFIFRKWLFIYKSTLHL